VVSDRVDVSDAVGDEEGGGNSVLESAVYEVVRELPSSDLLWGEVSRVVLVVVSLRELFSDS
jgi:hypothetical protein